MENKTNLFTDEPIYTPFNADGLLEFFSARQHEIWASWVKYHLEHELQEDGTIVIPAGKVEKWKVLAKTPYEELSADDQEKDREVVREYLDEALFVEETCFCFLCCDFDGFLHQYTSGWEGADVISDPPVEGAIPALYHYLNKGKLTVAIHSARSGQHNGISAMRSWLSKHDEEYRFGFEDPDFDLGAPLVERIAFPVHKPAAQVYADDRGFRFNGPPFPSLETIFEASKVWYENRKHARGETVK